MKVYNVEEYNLFRQQLPENKHLIFDLLFYTGIRIGELLALVIGDYDEVNQTININKSIDMKQRNIKFLVYPPKTRASFRTIKLPSDINTSLQHHISRLKRLEGYKSEWFILGSLAAPASPSSITSVKNRAADKAHIKRIRLHDFRHSHASMLIEAGVNIKLVAQRLGHSDVAMTLNVYTHVLDQSEDKAVQMINNIIKTNNA